MPLNLDKESLGKIIFKLAYPAVLENILLMAVYIFDAAIVGWLRDESALAGTMLAGSIFMVIGTPFQAISVAVNALVSRNWGANDREKAGLFARQVLALGWICAFIMMVMGLFFAPHLLRWMGGKPDVVKAGTLYFRIVILSLPLQVPLFMSSGILRGTGDTTSPMIITLIMNAFNVLLCWILAFGIGPIPAMGLAGVGWGATLAQGIGGITAFIVLIKGLSNIRIPITKCLTWKMEVIRPLWILAYPVMIERFFTSSAGLVFMSIVAKLGTTALAAHNVALRIESIAFMPPWGLSVAIATIVGQSLGAKRPAIAEKAVKTALIWISYFMALLAILFVLFSRQMVMAFGATPEVRWLAGTALKIAALEMPFLAFFNILAGCLRGAGDTKSPLYVMSICLLVFRFGVVYLFAITFNWGLPGVWLATSIDWMARSSGLWYVFHRGKWKSAHETLMRKIIA
jgi:putative MATE family efflux protein